MRFGAALMLLAVSASVALAAEPEVVITPDNDRRQPADPLVFPNRAIAYITLIDPANRTDITRRVYKAHCTGWFVNANTIVTAGHCIYNRATGAFFPLRDFVVWPGFVPNSPNKLPPFGSCTARRLYTVAGYTDAGATNAAASSYDYGAIKLNCNIGNRVGRFGMVSFPAAASLNGAPATVTGYPGEKRPLGSLFTHTDQVRATSTSEVAYLADTTPGQSGSPVFYNRSSRCNPCAYAIHTRGPRGGEPRRNSGVRLIPEVYANILAWMKDTRPANALP